jgi:hypothetical protein
MTDIGSAGRSSVLAQPDPAAPIDAAFANAAMIRTLRQEDSLTPSGIHAGAVTVPVALAMGEHLGSTGREVITALVAGFDVCGKLDRLSPGTRGAAHQLTCLRRLGRSRGRRQDVLGSRRGLRSRMGSPASSFDIPERVQCAKVPAAGRVRGTTRPRL